MDDIHNHDPQRRQMDRRQRPTGPFDAFLTPARRLSHRRALDITGHRPRYLDRYGLLAGIYATLLLILTIVDGTITMILLDMHCEEANPLMAYLIELGLLPFLLGKYALTAAGLPVLLIFKEHRMFGTCFRVGYLLPIFVGMYVLLLGHQLQLLKTPLPTSWPGQTEASVLAA